MNECDDRGRKEIPQGCRELALFVQGRCLEEAAVDDIIQKQERLSLIVDTTTHHHLFPGKHDPNEQAFPETGKYIEAIVIFPVDMDSHKLRIDSRYLGMLSRSALSPYGCRVLALFF